MEDGGVPRVEPAGGAVGQLQVQWAGQELLTPTAENSFTTMTNITP